MVEGPYYGWPNQEPNTSAPESRFGGYPGNLKTVDPDLKTRDFYLHCSPSLERWTRKGRADLPALKNGLVDNRSLVEDVGLVSTEFLSLTKLLNYAVETVVSES